MDTNETLIWSAVALAVILGLLAWYVVYKGREKLMDRWKSVFAQETEARTLAEIIAGADIFLGLSAARVLKEPDRRVAIGLAIEHARPGDVVVIAGKGHETTQTFADRVIAFDDRQVAHELLESRS